jgi:AcrR family transcriptional regulator
MKSKPATKPPPKTTPTPTPSTRRKPTAQRWGAGQNAAPDEARMKLIAAARACYAKQAIEKTTMADIAARAKVARATLYRHFPNREAVLMAVFREETRDFLDLFRSKVGEAESFCEFLLDYLVFTLKQAPQTPLHQALFSEQAALWVSRNYLDDPESIKLTVDFFRESFRVARRVGEIRDDIDLDEIVGYQARLLLTFLLMPNTEIKNEVQLRAYLERHFIRALRAQPEREAGSLKSRD